MRYYIRVTLKDGSEEISGEQGLSNDPMIETKSDGYRKGVEVHDLTMGKEFQVYGTGEQVLVLHEGVVRRVEDPG